MNNMSKAKLTLERLENDRAEDINGIIVTDIGTLPPQNDDTCRHDSLYGADWPRRGRHRHRTDTRHYPWLVGGPETQGVDVTTLLEPVPAEEKPETKPQTTTNNETEINWN
jgi:hypothetical protein